MRALIQRVTSASVSVDGTVCGAIGKGYLVLLGICGTDTEAEVRRIADKMIRLRIFSDEAGKINRSLTDVGGGILLISQFTLLADARHGRRPSYIRAARPETAVPLYEYCRDAIARAVPVETGRFQAEMRVSLVNDGPHTILLDSKRSF